MFQPVLNRANLGLQDWSNRLKSIPNFFRLLNIWQERNIFDPKIQTDLQRIWTKKSLEVAAENLKDASTPPRPDEPRTPPLKKAKTGLVTPTAPVGYDLLQTINSTVLVASPYSLSAVLSHIRDKLTQLALPISSVYWSLCHQLVIGTWFTWLRFQLPPHLCPEMLLVCDNELLC